MGKIKNALRGAFAAVMAAAFALALVPSVALAADLPKGTLSVTAAENETVTITKIASTKLNADNTVTSSWEFFVSFTAEVKPTPENYNTGDNAKTNLNDILVSVNTKSPGPAATVTGTNESVSLDPGLYLVTVNSEDDYVYQTTIIAVNPVANDEGVWETPEVKAGDNSTVITAFSTDNIKKDVPEAEKTQTDPANGGSAYVGQLVSYEASSSVPRYSSDKTNLKYELSDVMSNGLVLNGAVTVNGLKSGDYTITYYSDADMMTTVSEPAGAVAYKLVLFPEKVKDYADVTVTLSYTAKVTSDAVITEASTNNFKVEYSHYFGTDTGSDDTETKLYTTGLTFTKVNSEGDALKGAVFTVYLADENGDATDTVVATSTEKNGVISISGLGKGSFVLVETTVPAGYKAIDPVKFTVEENETWFEMASGKITSGKYVKVSAANGTLTAGVADNSATVVDEEDTSYILPSTGGAGTVGLTIAGVAIMAGAAVFVIRSRKEQN